MVYNWNFPVLRLSRRGLEKRHTRSTRQVYHPLWSTTTWLISLWRLTRCQASNIYGRVVSTLVHVRGVVEEALVIRSLSRYHFSCHCIYYLFQEISILNYAQIHKSNPCVILLLERQIYLFLLSCLVLTPILSFRVVGEPVLKLNTGILKCQVIKMIFSRIFLVASILNNL